MARPRMSEEQKRIHRVTLYLDKQEQETLSDLARATETDMTKLILSALRQYAQGLENPPEALRKARQERITQKQQEMTTGYICERGHAFWLESAWPGRPRCCPACGAGEIKTTWSGMINRGFS